MNNAYKSPSGIADFGWGMSSSSFGRGSLTSTSMAAGAVAAAAIFLVFCSDRRARSRRLRRRASAALAGAATSDELAGLARGAAQRGFTDALGARGDFEQSYGLRGGTAVAQGPKERTLDDQHVNPHEKAERFFREADRPRARFSGITRD